MAAAYALAGFATDATHISSSGSALALTGLANAGLNSQNLASVVTGTAAGYGANSIAPVYNTIMIANILASCINGATANSACYTLFQYTQTAGASGSKATDTASAAIHLAHNPYPTAAGVTALYGLTSGTPAFAGGLSTQPNDFTLGIQFSNNNCFNYAAHGLAIDAAGSAWSLGGHGICKFSSTGTSLNSYYGFNYGACFTAGQNLAIDTSGNVWVPNSSLNRLCEVSNSGAAISPSGGYPASGNASDNGGLSTPLAVAIDGSGNVWIANQQAAGSGTIGSLSEFSSSGTAKSGPNGFTDSEPRAAFYGVAIDVSGNVWAGNYSYGSLVEYNPNSGFLSPAATGYYGGGLSNPIGIAIDGSGNVWAADNYNSSLSKFTSGGSPVSPTGAYGGYVGGGLNSPYGMAIDSAGNVWIANFNNNSVSQFTNGGIAVTSNPAYTGSGTIYAPINVAVDGSGDVWVTNSNGNLTEMIGAAGPVVTPVVANLVSPYGTVAVNRP